MIAIVNSIAKCSNGKHPTRDGDPTGIAIHRFGVESVHDAQSLAKWSFNQPSVGGKMPYSYVIDRDGVIEQALPDHRWGWHCRGKSKIYLAVALLGDFRASILDPVRESLLVQLCAMLAVRYGFSETSVFGHSEVPGGTAWVNHDCPGRKISMPALRLMIKEEVVKEKLRQTEG